MDPELVIIACFAEQCVKRAHVIWLGNVGQRFGYEYGARQALKNTVFWAEELNAEVEVGNRHRVFFLQSEVQCDARGGCRRRSQWHEEAYWQSETLGLYYEMLKSGCTRARSEAA